MDQMTAVLLMLQGEWPMQTRPNVAPTSATKEGVSGMCFGLVYGLGGQGMKVSKVSECFPELTTFVNAAVAASALQPAGDMPIRPSGRR